MSIKTERIASLIVKEVSYILLTEIKNKDLKNITLTDCKVTGDLSFAKIYYIISRTSDKNDISTELTKASSFIRKKLAERIEIRHIPQLQFVYDESIEYGGNIEVILNEINKKM